MKNEKRLLIDMENAYGMTLYDIRKYVRQTGSISIDVVKRLINFNYFNNTNPVKLWSYTTNDENHFIVAMDMFDLQLWILQNYDIEVDKLDDIEEELDYLTTFAINKP